MIAVTKPRQAESSLYRDALRACTAAAPAVADEGLCARMLAAIWSIADSGVGVRDEQTGRLAVPVLTAKGVLSIAGPNAEDLERALVDLSLAIDDLVSKGLIRYLAPCNVANLSSWYEVMKPGRYVMAPRTSLAVH